MTKDFKEKLFWDERFENKDYIYGKEANDFLRENVLVFQSGSKILNLAEGEGRNAVFLAGDGHDVTAVDFSEAGRKKALNLAKANNVSINYEIADLNNYDMKENEFDAIVSIFCHPSANERKALFAKIRKALNPEGVFFLESYHKKQIEYGTGGPSNIENLITLEEMKEEFSDGFDIVHAKETEREVHEGSYHTGLAYTVQFIAKKIS